MEGIKIHFKGIIPLEFFEEIILLKKEYYSF